MSKSREMDQHDDYAELKSFVEAFSRKYFPRNNLAAEQQPLALLAVLEKKGRTFAHRQLRQLVSDCVEMSRALPEDEVRRFDSEAAAAGIVGLSEMRRRHLKAYRRILSRGEIRTEDEYRLVQTIADNTADTADTDELALVSRLLRAYEEE